MPSSGVKAKILDSTGKEIQKLKLGNQGITQFNLEITEATPSATVTVVATSQLCLDIKHSATITVSS
jgi:hypothetical protein